MEPPADLRPERVDEPLLTVGILGLLAGLATVALMSEVHDPADVARGELAAMATRVSFLVIALAGTWVRATRSAGVRPIPVVLAVGLAALLAHELDRIYDFEWLAEEISIAHGQLTSPVYVLAALVVIELASPYSELPRPQTVAPIEGIRRIALALVALGVLATVIGLVSALTRRSELGLVASTAACAVAIAVISGTLALARHGRQRSVQWLAAIGAGLLTWAVVIHAIHGCLLYLEWMMQKTWVYFTPPSLYGDWLSALSHLAPVATAAGLIALILAVGLMRRRPSDRTECLVALWVLLAATGLYVVQHALLVRLAPFDESMLLVIFLYAAPLSAIAPFLWDVARDLERQHASSLASARLA